MSRRRTATVTISAPDASSAALVCSRSLYLPVPTIRREPSSRVSMRSRSDMTAPWCLAPAHELHDLELIAVAQGRGRVQGARHDFTVALHGDRAGLDAELHEQRRDRDAGRDLARLAVDLDAHGPAA